MSCVQTDPGHLQLRWRSVDMSITSTIIQTWTCWLWCNMSLSYSSSHWHEEVLHKESNLKTWWKWAPLEQDAQSPASEWAAAHQTKRRRHLRLWQRIGCLWLLRTQPCVGLAARLSVRVSLKWTAIMSFQVDNVFCPGWDYYSDNESGQWKCAQSGWSTLTTQRWITLLSSALI